jgi:hypothetical protein
VKSQTQNYAVLGELGRFPLSVICQEKSLKYYTQLKSNPESLMCKVFSAECNSNNDKTWALSVKKLLYNLGLNDIWCYFYKDVNYF